jgi:hypothetical protein
MNRYKVFIVAYVDATGKYNAMERVENDLEDQAQEGTTIVDDVESAELLTNDD